MQKKRKEKHFLDKYLDDWLLGNSMGKEGEVKAIPLLEEFLEATGAVKKGKQIKINKKKLDEVQ